MKTLRIALAQLDCGPDKAANVDKALSYIEQAANRGADLVALPENFHLRAGNHQREQKIQAAEDRDGALIQQLRLAAAQNSIHVLAGSFGERHDGERIFNTSLLIDTAGVVRGSYRKIHLFDVSIHGAVDSRESAVVAAGSEIVTVDTDLGILGMSICYDLRFPELYRALALNGATMAFVPANFTSHTGRDHWEVLLRARAIENGMFIVAPAQIGKVEGSFEAYGRSMVVDPWGTVIACAPDGEGLLVVDVDPDAVQSARRRLPGLHHRRPDAYERLSLPGSW